jgi:hypothetical protein
MNFHPISFHHFTSVQITPTRTRRISTIPEAKPNQNLISFRIRWDLDFAGADLSMIASQIKLVPVNRHINQVSTKRISVPGVLLIEKS